MQTHTHIYIYTLYILYYIYIYIFVCVCVCLSPNRLQFHGNSEAFGPICHGVAWLEAWRHDMRRRQLKSVGISNSSTPGDWKKKAVENENCKNSS